MSDSISPEELKRRLVLFLRIQAEVWTEVLKMLPRRTLVQNIAPACFRLKEICDKNVKSIHVIKNAKKFHDKLEKNDPKANKQLKHLTANKCQLAGHFELTKFDVSNRKSKVIVRHSLDLFCGCKLSFDANEQSEDGKMVFLDECLGILESAKPVTIQIDQHQVREPDGTFWLHPTVQNCGRIVINIWPNSSNENPLRTFVAISHWLHHWPMDCDGEAADQQQVRCMIVWCAYPNHLDWLLGRYSKNIQQGREPTDRRPFVLSFNCFDSDWSGYGQFQRIENKSTGEVLTLDRVIDEDGKKRGEFRLRRCLAEEETNGPEFYAEMFKRNEGYDEFNIGEEETAKVTIG